MSTLAIFLYGTFVFALVGTALALIAWGIVIDRRSRLAEEPFLDSDPDRAAGRPRAENASTPTPST